MEPIRIVIADDHALVREGTARILAQYPDFEIVGRAGNGLQALEMVQELKPDLLMSDIRMPDMNAIEMMRRLKESHHPVKVMILSAYDDDDYVVSLLQLGVSAYLLKTVDLGELAEAIRVVYLGQVVIDPTISSKIVRGLAASGAALHNLDSLTRREADILKLAAAGKDNRQIGEALALSVRTIEGHLGHIYAKLSVSTRQEAIRIARS
jgi:two-component system response regulator DegU